MNASAPPAVRIGAVLLGLWGVLLFLTPLMATRPDGIVMSDGDIATRIAMITVSLIGVVMAITAAKVWRAYSPRAMIQFWAVFLVGLAVTPLAIFLCRHFGK